VESNSENRVAGSCIDLRMMPRFLRAAAYGIGALLWKYGDDYMLAPGNGPGPRYREHPGWSGKS
jgi:hypothetical protein